MQQHYSKKCNDITTKCATPLHELNYIFILYFCIFLHSVERLMPRSLAALVWLPLHSLSAHKMELSSLEV